MSRKILIISFFIFFLVVIFEIWVVNRLSSYGERINFIEKTAAELQMQNQILKNQIDKHSAIATAKQNALKMGFDKAQNIEYLHLSNTIQKF